MAITAKRNAKVEITASTSKFDAGLRDARKKLKAFGSGVKSAFKGAGSLLGKIGGGMSMGLGMGALGGVESIVGDVMANETALTRFQIAGDQSAQQMEKFRASLSNVASATGVAKGELISGAAAYVALTGDAGGAAAAVGTFAKVSNATGASMADIAGAAASMRQNLQIDPSEFEAAFSALHVQGKAGAVELRELAAVMSSVAPQFTSFAGGTGTQGLVDMGAALQVLRKGFGSSEQAATGLQALMSSITQNAGKFEKAGVNVFTKNSKTGAKELRGFYDVMAEIQNSDLVKDPTLMAKAFGSSEALRAFMQIKQNGAAVDDLIAKSKDAGAIERDAAKFRDSTAGKLQASMAALKESIADAFTPERIENFVNAIMKVGAALGWIAEKTNQIGQGLGIATGGAVEDMATGDGFWGKVGAITGIGKIAKAAGAGARTADGKTPAQAREYADYVEAQGDEETARKKARYAREREAKAAAARGATEAPVINTAIVIDGTKVGSAVANSKDPRRGVHG